MLTQNLQTCFLPQVIVQSVTESDDRVAGGGVAVSVVPVDEQQWSAGSVLEYLLPMVPRIRNSAFEPAGELADIQLVLVGI